MNTQTNQDERFRAMKAGDKGKITIVGGEPSPTGTTGTVTIVGENNTENRLRAENSQLHCDLVDARRDIQALKNQNRMYRQVINYSMLAFIAVLIFICLTRR